MPKKKLALKFDPRNARQHDESNKELIRKSLAEVGGFRSIAVDGQGIVRAGNATLEQALALGLEIVPIEVKPNQLVAVIRPDLKGRKAERAALLDNRAGETAGWEMSVLAEIASTDKALLEGIFAEQDVEAFAKLQSAIHQSLSDRPSDSDTDRGVEPSIELQKKWKTAEGQVWRIGEHHWLAIGSCENPASWIEAEAAAIITSPPYAEQRKAKYGGVPTTAYVDWWMAGPGRQMKKALAPDGSLFVNLKGHCERGQRTTYPYALVLRMVAEGWQFVDELCWVKTAYPGDMGKRFRNGFEPIYWFVHDTETYKFRLENVLIHKLSGFDGYKENLQTMQGTVGTKKSQALESVRPANVLTIVSDQTPNEETGGHPARFPPRLPEFCLLATTDPGDLVIDPFAGSGTTLIAANRQGRRCGLIEIMPNWGAAILERAYLNGLESKLISSGPAKK